MSSSSSNRPAWVHPARSARAFWTPALLVLGVSAALLLCWPRGERRGAGARAMPEPAAAYVVLGGTNAFSFSPERIGFGAHEYDRSYIRLEDLDRPAQHLLPPPAYSEGVRVETWRPTVHWRGSNAPPDLADLPLAADLVLDLPPATNGVQVSLSPGLQRGGFTFEVPFQISTTAPATATFHVELDAAGQVLHLLAEPSENPRSARLVETAINGGRGTRAARGEVQVSWGR